MSAALKIALVLMTLLCGVAQAQTPEETQGMKLLELMVEDTMRIDDQAILSLDRSRLVFGILAGFAVSASVTFAMKGEDRRKRLPLRFIIPPAFVRAAFGMS